MKHMAVIPCDVKQCDTLALEADLHRMHSDAWHRKHGSRQEAAVDPSVGTQSGLYNREASAQLLSPPRSQYRSGEQDLPPWLQNPAPLPGGLTAETLKLEEV